MSMWERPDDAAASAQASRVTPGFVLFLGALCLPAIAALAIFFGAWIVADEVEAASNEPPPGAEYGFEASPDVAGWKKALVGICPVH